MKKEKKGFICSNCGQFVLTSTFIGTAFRNHCPFCLWSTHVKDSDCGGLMEPVGLTFKHEGWDKYTGKPKQGELMVIHRCQTCGKISINRLAADDESKIVLNVLENSLKKKNQMGEELKSQNIRLLEEGDETEIKRQLFGG